MKRLVLAGVAAAMLGGVASRAEADDVAVIVNKGNALTALTMVQLRKIVLGQEAKWPTGGRIVVWMTTPGQRERSGVLKIVAGMSETDFTLHFMHSSFNGEAGDLPKTAASGPLVRQSVGGTVNAVGFIWASQVDDSVKVITIEGSRPGQPGYKLSVK
jgi:ABC-type phosphate transport system substrate-binding protein